MAKSDDALIGLLLLGLAFILVRCIVDASVRNDFCGDITLYAQGEYREAREPDWYGREQASRACFIGGTDVSDIEWVFVVPSTGTNAGSHVRLDLIPGECYVLYKKVGGPLVDDSYFIEHVPSSNASEETDNK